MEKNRKGLVNKKQGIETNEEHDKEQQIDIGEEDADIYKPLGRKHLLENDEISEKEEGVMEGYDRAGDYSRDKVKGKKDTEFQTMRREEEVFEKEMGVDINKDLRKPVAKSVSKSKPMKKSSVKSKRAKKK